MKPSSPPPDLIAGTARLKAAFDRLEARTDPKMRKLDASELAPAIKRQNEARAQRLDVDGSELANAREEICRALDYVREAIGGGTLAQGDANLLHASLTEYIQAVGSDTGSSRRRAIEAMREAVARMDRTQAKSTADR